MNKVLILILLIPFLIFGKCQQTKVSPLKPYMAMPKKLKEVSGLVFDSNTKTFWALQDKGNKPELYQIDTLGNIIHILKIKSKNTDWEELTCDNKGNLYIGDFGNNQNDRTDLRILKISSDSLYLDSTEPEYLVHFNYPEQTKFPGKKKELLYDAEAFILFENNFYIFTKNRSTNKNLVTLVYRVPNQPGDFKATLLTQIPICKTFRDCAITGATLVPGTKDVLLISNSSIFKLTNFLNLDFEKLKVSHYNLQHVSQKESICFKGPDTIFIADEKKKSAPSFIYQLQYQKLKSESEP
ncbi:SdiA-regulated domain-containing protein [Myroides sp. LJL119]